MRSLWLYLIAANLIFSSVECGFFGNKYFPSWSFPSIRKSSKSSGFYTSVFFMSGDKAFGQSDEAISIPELNGEFNLSRVDAAVRKAGMTSPLEPLYRGTDLRYTTEGKIQGQGLRLSYMQAFGSRLSMSATLDFMHVSSRQSFSASKHLLDTVEDNTTIVAELDQDRLAMNKLLGLNGDQWTGSGPSDCDLSFRYGKVADYALKCRKVDAGVSVGLLLPLSKKRDMDWPTSLTFGGGGHFGAYVSGDLAIELKECFKVGGFMQIGSRINKTQERLIPLSKEPQPYGAVRGLVNVEPGATFVISPFVSFDNLRGGFGASARMTFAVHGNDVWVDKRADKDSLPADFSFLNSKTEWSSEYINFDVYYDHASVSKRDIFAPVVHLKCDIPSSIFSAASRVSKTYGLSLGLEFKF